MYREKWQSDLWMAAQINYALAYNKSVTIMFRTKKERDRVKSTPSFSQMVHIMQANERHGTSYFYAYCALKAIRESAKEIGREVKRMNDAN